MADSDGSASDNQIVCFGVVRKDDVVVFDAEGQARSFRLQGDNGKRLCFSDHGHKEAADFLTPCLDDEGIHGVPDESCFCGVDEPHIHAHYHDEKTCSDAHKRKDFSHLANLILMPTDVETETSVHLQCTDSLPNKCNSQEVTLHLTQAGVKSNSSRGTDTALGRRMFKVKHGDHQDFLVHNSRTGDLHLEHECDDCGDTDVHGRLQRVSTRNLPGGVKLQIYEEAPQPFSLLDFFAKFFDPSSKRVHVARDIMPRAPGHGHAHHEKRISCCKSHAAQAMAKTYPAEPCCDDEASCCNTDCTSSVCEAGDPKPFCDSQKDVNGSCCKKDGVSTDCGSGNPKPCCNSQKGDLESNCCQVESTSTICGSGNPEPYCVSRNDDAAVSTSCKDDRPQNVCDSGTCCDSKRPCCEEGADQSCCASGICAATPLHKQVPLPGSGPSLVRSSFICKNICCASEIPVVRDILEDEEGIEKIMVNVPMKQVTVDHRPEKISAKDIESTLNQEGLGAALTRDGEKEASRLSRSISSGRSAFYVEKICRASEIPMINKIVRPMEGVNNISININTKMVYVDHDIHQVSASLICDALNRDGFGASIRKDAGEGFLLSLGAFVESTLLYTPATEANTDALENFLLVLDKSQLKHFEVDNASGSINISHNPILLPVASLSKAIRTKLSVDCTISRDGGMGAYGQDDDDDEESLGEESMTWPSIPTILSGIFWVVSFLSLVGENWDYVKYAALLSVAFGMPSIALKAFRTLQRCRFDTNVLMLSAATGAIALQEYSEAAAVTFLFSLSEWLEVRATTRARNALSAIVRLRPDKANLILPNSKELVTVHAAAVPVGSLVSIRTGDKIPCDGEVVQGQSTVDESSLTGESRPVRKGPGEMVSGGTINSGSAELTVRTTATADNSAVAKLIRLVEEAQANRSETEKLVDEFAKRYTPLVLLAALGMCTIPWFFGGETGRFWTHNGLVLMVVACPCALIISTPVTYVAGLAATAQRGILIKGGAHLEALAMVRKIFFDKTGTLTQGCFALLHLKVFNNKLSRETVLQHLSLVEERASHPLAEAIMAAIRNEGVNVPSNMTMKNHTQLAGEGVTATIGGSEVFVGNERLFKRLRLYGCIPLAIRSEAEAWAEAGGTVGFVSIGEHGVVCAYCVADGVREESATVLSDLQSMGIEATMLTGDNSDAALAIGAQVGLDHKHIRSQLFPKDKLDIVESTKQTQGHGTSSIFSNPFKTQSLVLMCGDGVNDAPALATADVGVAMGAGAALAMETSDVTLLDSNLHKLVYSLEMGRRVIRKIRENVIFSIVVKGIMVGFALAGKAGLWAAIASDVGAMLVVTMNGMLLLPYKKNNDNDVSVEASIAAKERDAELGGKVATKELRAESTRSSASVLMFLAK